MKLGKARINVEINKGAIVPIHKIQAWSNNNNMQNIQVHNNM